MDQNYGIVSRQSSKLRSFAWALQNLAPHCHLYGDSKIVSSKDVNTSKPE